MLKIDENQQKFDEGILNYLNNKESDIIFNID